MNLTADFTWTGEESNIYWGDMTGMTTYCNYNSADVCNDVYIIDLPMGYGFEVKISWNGTTSSGDYGLGIGPGDSSFVSTSSGSFGRCYAGGAGAAQYVGMSSDGNHDCPGFHYTYSTSPALPMQPSGEPVMAWVFGYFAYQSAVQEYQMNITVWPSDAGQKGDSTQQFGTGISTWDDGRTYIGQCSQYGNSGGASNCQVPSSTNNGNDQGTKTLQLGESYGLFVNHDNYADTESTLSVSCTSGTTYSAQGSASFPNSDGNGLYTTTFNGPDTCSVSVTDSVPDGGLEAYWSGLSPAVTGLLSTTTSVPTISAYGIVGAGDLSDIYAVVIPDDAEAEVSLDWDAAADLDLYAYSDPGFTNMIGSSLASGHSPTEDISFGTITDTTVYVKVSYYSAGSSAATSGYKLSLTLLPTVNPPCWFQDDGNTDGTPLLDGSGAGDAAGGYSSSPTSDPMNMTSSVPGSFSGMLCQTHDAEDWYSVTVPAYYGAWVKFNWTEITPDDNLYMYLYMDTGSSFGSYISAASGTTLPSTGAAATTNESYTWNSALRLPYESTLWIKVYVGALAVDIEFNYTVEVRLHNQSGDYWGQWDDAGSGTDAGNSSYSVMNPLVLNPVNETYTSQGHDMKDRYDLYQIYVPENYGLHITVDAADYDDVDLYIKRLSNPTSTSMTNIVYDTGYGDKELWGQLDQGGQDQFIVIYYNVGGGSYTLDVEMMTEDNDPNPQDDCGLGVDAGGSAYSWINGGPNPAYGNTWMNASTQVDANGDADDVGGTCRGWISNDWDEYDWINILVPAGRYIMINATFNGGMQTSTVSMRLHMCPYSQYVCNSGGGAFGAPNNPAYFASQEASGTPSSVTTSGVPLTINSALWPVGGAWTSFRISTLSANYVDYDLEIIFPSLSELPGGHQDDGGSGGDAGPFSNMAIHIDPTNPDVIATDADGDGINEMLNWSGWNHNIFDTTDRYSFDVPADYGYEVCVNWDGIQYYNSGWNSWLLLDISTNGQYSSIPNPYLQNPICWNSSSYGYFGGEVNHMGVRNWVYFRTAYYEQDYTVNVTFFSMDADGDGWYNDVEISCGTDPYNSTSVPQDTDADGICDLLDTDTDGDGIVDADDDFPLDPNEWNDNDGDGIGDNVDTDLDDDGWLNDDETDCMTDPMNDQSVPLDFDNDTICDILDTDDDNDGVDDIYDVFPYDSTEWSDNDSDGVGDNQDEDDDNDGYADQTEIECSSNPLDVGSIPNDQDLDGICDMMDTDMDGDGYDNDNDAFPEDPSEWADFDGDGFGDNTDSDDDNDGWTDVDDAFPFDSSEWIDTDGDGVGDNGDLNDDGDAWTDSDEHDCGSDSLDADSVPDDYDSDGICDKVDEDNDGDGVPDVSDAFPYDATETTDNDFDGVGDLSDQDDDNDGWLDIEEPNCATDPMDPFSVPADLDGDRQCDLVDSDDDNDGVLDNDDDFPRDPNEQNDLDGDGIGDNSDPDDDGDLWLDVTELICLRGLDGVMNTADDGYGDPMSASVTPVDNESTESLQGGPDGLCNSIDPDDDGDGYPDPIDPDNIQAHEDAFKWDHTEWHDANNDGMGDEGTPLTFMDNVQADPQPFAIALLAIIGLVVVAKRAMGGDEEEDEFEGIDETEAFMDEDELEEAIDEAFDEEDED